MDALGLHIFARSERVIEFDQIIEHDSCTVAIPII